MCGFIQLFKKDIGEYDICACREGAKEIIHRGPNDTKEVIHENALFIFNRLSIIDIENGAQPFKYKDKYTIVFNGEIYNYKELREELIKEGYEFKTNSEIEVIASLYDNMESELVNKLRGMFAIVIYDKENEKITAFRDYFGIKPLYYMNIGGGLYFSSELKGLKNIYSDLTYRNNLLGEYATFQYIPSHDSVFKEIKMLEPGHTLERELNGKIRKSRYFNITFNEKEHDKEELKKNIKQVIKDSVKMHLESDVPVATFLSSGIDSSIITKIASDINPNIVSYTIGFDIDGYDETELAKKFAKDIGIKNVSIKLNHKDYIRELPKIVYHMDSPIGDPSIIPLYHICKEVSNKYKVILSGEGSDEFFGGYNIYTEDESLKMFNYMPKFIKGALRGVASTIPDTVKGKSFIMRGTIPLEKRYAGNANIFNKDEKAKVFYGYDKSRNDLKITEELFKHVDKYDNVIKRQYIDINTWLVGDILTKADRMSMAHSLEVRVPFVDKEVFKLASTLKKEDKIKGFTTKYMLRESFKDELPEYLYDKKKLGYPVPIRVWLKKELYNWAYNIIDNNPVKEINKDEILSMLKKHKDGVYDYSRKIWSMIIYILWYRLYVDKTLDKDFIFEA
ncbi:asparagine synthase (glutamine-hydrolyzing) [Clostridium baratii]|uniref:asparagine synthase (glutamine-hydrolyzing) n=1 Tax=Clostridium baratii TaxID=1561 RepID=UPI0009A41563|nr:asparagine synthase (glutamine-hydrolyzing) [Clostridium baratii]OPF50533.1 asparagine synthetase B [Clostridium baratii]OPF54221.1 asparagine synthase (glutamine-hydrolyzing) [Clostridium baratii]OPF58786.1 asparagine synthase (glutamine-hydrolyzing) [Clostridium baratii]OPF58842.1 asparagine synthase (glutamine-hydrolyzing) [Clostridium baratii]